MTKLSPYVLNADHARAFIERAGSPIVILCNQFGFANELRAAFPSLFITGRSTSDYSYHTDTTDPIGEAVRYVASIIHHVIGNPAIDAWKLVNEPAIKTASEMLNYARFSYECARLIKAQTGRRAVIGNFSVYNPADELIPHFRRGFEAVRDFQAITCNHEYTNMSAVREGVCHGKWKKYKELAAGWGLPFSHIIGECGLDNLPPLINDKGMDAAVAPFREYYGGDGPAECAKYVDVLMAYEQSIANEPGIIGAAVYCFGDWSHTPGGPNFNVANCPAWEMLAERLRTQTPPPIPTDIRKVITTFCRVRATPNGATVCYLGNGDRVTVHSTVGAWCECTIPGIANRLWIGKSVLGKA